MWVNIQCLKQFQRFGMSCCVFPSHWGARKRKIKHVLGFGVVFFFQWCEAFSDLYLSAFYCTQISLGRGRVRPLHCNCSCLMCSSVVQPSVTGKIFNWTFLRCFFFYYDALLQPDKHTAGLFTCTTEQANHHLALTGAFHEPTMSASHLPSCVLSVHLLHSTQHVTLPRLMVNSKPILHTCMNK